MKIDPNIRFHLQALAAAGNKHASRVVKGLELLGWPKLDSRLANVRVETVIINRPEPDVIARVKRLGWAMTCGDASSALNTVAFFAYKGDFTIHV